MTRKTADPLAQATRIVEDATVVDWSRDPLTDYEAVLREEMLAQMMSDPLGWCQISRLADECEADAIGTDLALAAREAVRRIEDRLAEYRRQDLEAAREAAERRLRARRAQ